MTFPATFPEPSVISPPALIRTRPHIHHPGCDPHPSRAWSLVSLWGIQGLDISIPGIPGILCGLGPPPLDL